MKDVKKEMKEVTGRVDDHEERIKTLEKGDAGGRGRGGAQSGGGGVKSFMPQHLEVKGYCTFEERTDKGATREMIAEFIQKFKDSLITEEEKGWIGKPQIRAKKMFKFKVKINPEYIWEVRDMWKSFIEENDITLADATPYLIVERSPEQQVIFNKMGKTFGILQKKFKDKIIIEGDFRAKEFHVKKKKDDEKKKLLTINDDLSYTWSKEGVDLTGMTEEELAAMLA
jgi:hypothetical protein